jgi:hypothetical protein
MTEGAYRCAACGELFDSSLHVCAPVAGPARQNVDMVNHPPHYTAHPSGIECITITRHMNFNIGNVIKYCWRAGSKGSTVEDLKKAAWYLADEIKKLEGEKK